ncbi:hypothetical protein FHS31_001655 [Sphingomonas vulcanisoli]|uniref:N-acetyltransferase domain-containing protein n=1 Tax=Sphingomonas vulcanisoli TaxID=1658060 RepID=A0ABX0TU92_9SPHN|nr:GNAT family N-acetyltransferase [Sphingomonas vulcanisoli]NIJ08045.1 hypothetical protein [Sphingomonas vulcanisoli]
MSGDPRDRPVWNALTGRQAALTIADGPAVRFRHDIGIFAATADSGAANLEALARLAGGEPFAMLEAEAPPAPPSYRQLSAKPCLQMVLDRPSPVPPPVPFVELTPEDGPTMLALALLTEPGPFKTNTYELGGFIGIKQGGALIAMAGQRLQPEGYVEVSGVCTHPDHRGQGYAAALMTIVAQRILERGETPILHSYAANVAANALYERLGYRTRRELLLTMLAPL